MNTDVLCGEYTSEHTMSEIPVQLEDTYFSEEQHGNVQSLCQDSSVSWKMEIGKAVGVKQMIRLMDDAPFQVRPRGSPCFVRGS